MKFISLGSVVLSVALLVGCGSIESGDVGVRTTFTGKIVEEELDQGFYTAITSNITRFSTRENSIPLNNMQPKAADNLSLEDLDVDIFYKVRPDAVAELSIKYSGQHMKKKGQDSLLPAGMLVYSYARDAVYDAVSAYESLEIHRNRDTLRVEVQESLQKALEQENPGIFYVTKVVIRNVQTDRAVEKSIADNVAAQKELERQKTQVEIAKKQAERNRELDASLTPAVLKQQELDTLREVCSVSRCILTLGGDSPKPVYSIK